MKYVLFFLVISLVSACEKKNEIDRYPQNTIISLEDTVITASNLIDPSENSGIFELDIDHDQIVDIVFSVTQYSLGRESNRFTDIEMKNGYELAIQSSYKVRSSYYNTGGGNILMNLDSQLVRIPENLNFNDTLSTNKEYSNEITELVYSGHNSFTSASWQDYCGYWIGVGEGFIGIWNQSLHTFAWIKISVLDFDKLMLKAYLYSQNQEFIIIGDVSE